MNLKNKENTYYNLHRDLLPNNLFFDSMLTILYKIFLLYKFFLMWPKLCNFSDIFGCARLSQLCSSAINCASTHHWLKLRENRKKNFFLSITIQDLKEYINDCLTCQKLSPFKNIKALQSYSLINSPGIWNGTDIMGPLFDSNKGNKFVFPLIDHFSRFIQTYSIPSIKRNYS